MAKIHTAGETVFDIIFENGTPTGGNPGGSVLNTSVSLGRLGLAPRFLTDICSDMLGENIKKFLADNGVEAVSVIEDSGMKTSVALAFLDEHKNARYQFYKSRPGKCHDELFRTDFKPGDIFLFGSFYGIMPEIRSGMKRLIDSAKDNGVLTVYDPNFRAPHLPDLPRVMPFIEENIAAAGIVKGSDEDFNLIFKASTFDEAVKAVRQINPDATLFYTKGAAGCVCNHQGNIVECDAPPIKPVSTIGAGDNFNAGIVYGLVKHNINLNSLQQGIGSEVIKDIMTTATKLAQEVCMSQANYIAKR
ncbi:MAG: carbohydrate kinase [Bacteroidales bacterium]|nr:carbohydrate kinase [Bacteroidales bacterium]MBO7142079.1 carbohydrate kinase [Bacteroidales bacterium]